MTNLSISEPNPLPTELRRSQIAIAANVMFPYLHRLSGKPPASMETKFQVAGKKVYFVHNPKCAGTSLKNVLGCTGGKTYHIGPTPVLRRKTWQAGIFVVSVRDPFDRFVSAYFYHVKGAYKGALYKKYGDRLKNMGIKDYLWFIQQFPDFFAPQTHYTHYPNPAKSKCDIILRFEDSQNWPRTLADAGIVIAPGEMPRKNTGSNNPKAGRLQSLGLSRDARSDLRLRVQDVYRQDYQQLGYPRVSG